MKKVFGILLILMLSACTSDKPKVKAFCSHSYGSRWVCESLTLNGPILTGVNCGIGELGTEMVLNPTDITQCEVEVE